EVIDAAELRYLLVTGQAAGGVLIAVENGRTVTISPAQLAPYWKNRAYLLWKNPLDLPLEQGPFQNAREIVALQSLLNSVGKNVPGSGRYDDLTSAAIRTFQDEQQLPVDGIAGMQTLIALYRESRLYGYPILLTGGDQ
ncbi:MAG: peptidoglycan-binding domain-containing protein, partial [Desulfuromonadales bacterium]|nr:peptidoglycan-binding domain-containing protein [Desulfuromonadales bacterium]